MEKIIPFKKEIIFNDGLAEITSISLEHDLSINDNSVNGLIVQMPLPRHINEEVIFDFKFSHDAVSFRHVADRRTSERFHIGRQWRIYPEQCQFYP